MCCNMVSACCVFEFDLLISELSKMVKLCLAGSFAGTISRYHLILKGLAAGFHLPVLAHVAVQRKDSIV